MHALSKADTIYSGIRNIMILRPSIEKCLFGIAAMGFPDPGGGERFFFKFFKLKVQRLKN